MCSTRLPAICHQISSSGGPSSQDVWTVLQSLPPDVTRKGDPCKRGVDPLYDEVQHIMGNGHIG